MMHQSKLHRLLSTFPTTEIGRLQIFLESPYFNTNKNIVALYAYTLRFAPHFNDQGLSPEHVFDAIFPNEGQRDDKKEVIIKLSSKLFSLVNRYIEHNMLEKESFTAALFRKKWFRAHGCTEWEEEALITMEKEQDKKPFQDDQYAHNRFVIEFEKVKWELGTHLIVEKLNLNALNISLDEYYLQTKLECLCHLVNHSMVANKTYHTPELPLIEALLEVRMDSISAVTKTWFFAFKLLNNPVDAGLFQQLKQQLSSVDPILPPIWKQTFFLYLTNVARLSFPNPQVYFAELFEIYQLQINTGVLLHNGVMPPETFFNILSVALRQKEKDWAMQFMADYSSMLDIANDKTQDMLALCNSMLAFSIGNFEHALDFLNKTHFKDVQSKLSERRLRLKIYLELGYDDLFSDQVNAFRKFLSVNKALVPNHHEEGNRNFINLIHAIFRLKTGFNETGNSIRHQMAQMDILPEKIWLEEKLNTVESAGGKKF